MVLGDVAISRDCGLVVVDTELFVVPPVSDFGLGDAVAEIGAFCSADFLDELSPGARVPGYALSPLRVWEASAFELFQPQ